MSRGLDSGHRWRIYAKSSLRPSSWLVLNSGNYSSLLGGKELTPLPPQEENSSSPPPLPTLGPLWGTNGEGDDATEKDLPATEGSLGLTGAGDAPLPWRGRGESSNHSPLLWNEGG